MTLLLALIALASAGPLDDYAEQKHTDRDKVTKKTCEDAYIQRCSEECKPGDEACVQECKQEAPEFCKERQKRKVKKTVGVVAKGTSVGAGAAVVVASNAFIRRHGEPVAGSETELTPSEPDPYQIAWFRTTLAAEAGGGLLLGPVGVGTGHARVRWAWFGLAGTTHNMFAEGTFLSESDLGPTFSIHSPNIIFTLQPSLLVSHHKPAEPVEDETWDPTLFGGGVRSYTTLHMRQVMVHFDPMLGLINGQWNYHVRLGVGYRFHPRAFVRVNYDYRDIVDLTDLDISQARLQGLVLTLGARFN